MNLYKQRILEGRKEFLRLVQKQDEKLLKIYIEASKQVSYKLSKANAGSLTARHLSELDKSLRQYVEELTFNLSKSTKEGIEAASQIASAVQLSYFDMIAPRQDIKNTFIKMFTKLPTDITKQLINGGYYSDGKTLDQRIWNIGKKNESDIDTLIKINVAKGANARELAKELDAYINPLSRIEPKTLEAGMSRKISYPSQRLARTSLTHANAESYIQGSKMNPFNKGLKWNLSPSHYERQVAKHGKDECDEYASQNNYELGNGVFPPDKYPVAHPNCLCYPTQENVDIDKARDELIAWVNGEDNPKLDKWLDDYGEKFGIEKNKSNTFIELAVSKDENVAIINNKLSSFTDKVKNLNVTEYTDRTKLGKDILSALDLKDVNVRVKKISANGYCAFNYGPNDEMNIYEYVLKSDDNRGNNYKIKTAFHEAFHAKANGMKFDYKELKENWLNIEEPFAESAAHYLVKQVGITEEISPSYSEKLVEMLPRLKQLDKFKDCNNLSDFGQIAWSDRLDGVNPEWKQLYDECMNLEHDWKEYSKAYHEYIIKHKDELVDVLLNNMPEHISYRSNMINDCENAIDKINSNKNISQNENIIFKNALAIAMNRLGVK